MLFKSNINRKVVYDSMEDIELIDLINMLIHFCVYHGSEPEVVTEIIYIIDYLAERENNKFVK